ncbi:MAG: trypsin-like peptidase domain-containing protein [Betaproteobacteria bacterium]|nr:trypsin-like peptidase domain-containing protein [Betaproteobacteria bacterium]
MRLSDSYLCQIVYLGFPRPDNDHELDVHGTGFLLAHEGDTYLVTAAHVAVDLDESFAVRLNREDSGLGDLKRIDHATWYYHPDDTVDVAVMPFTPPKWAKVNYAKSKWIATEFKVQSKDIGPGDLAYVVGIFQKMRGKEKNLPVVHTGHIGSMAHGEKLITDDWRPGAKNDAKIEIEGYLVQVPTLPESSGSPVYVRRSLAQKTLADIASGYRDRASDRLRAWMHGSVWLLGLWHGTWNTEEKGVVVATNMGACIPAPRILETLDRKELKAMRKAAKEKRVAAIALTPQSASDAVARDRDGILGAMLSQPPQPRKKSASRSANRK